MVSLATRILTSTVDTEMQSSSWSTRYEQIRWNPMNRSRSIYFFDTFSFFFIQHFARRPLRPTLRGRGAKCGGIFLQAGRPNSYSCSSQRRHTKHNAVKALFSVTGSRSSREPHFTTTRVLSMIPPTCSLYADCFNDVVRCELSTNLSLNNSPLTIIARIILKSFRPTATIAIFLRWVWPARTRS